MPRTIIRSLYLALLCLAFQAPAQAESEAECSIWLCLPGAFPAGCAAAYSAFIARVTHIPPKPPLPAWGSCAVDSGDGMGASDGVAAYVPEQPGRCVRTQGKNDRCVAWGDPTPAHYVKGRSCFRGKDGYSNPEGCTGTFHYVEVYQNGQQLGETYYWR